ncbi:MAG: AAA family ATPase [Desulfonatronovibrionaceae bacterium]
MSGEETRGKRLFAAANYLQNQGQSANNGCRIVVTGKGGVGKTTTTALMAQIMARWEINVLAVDEDPQQNLAFSLGFPLEKTAELIPVSKNIAYIQEKTGARPGESWGTMLRINPDVSDVVRRFGMKISENINLLVIGSVIQAATGCLCPENALLDSIVRYIRLREDEMVIMDTQAGVEHFGRALADGFRHAVIMTEPSFNSIQVALHSASLARELHIPEVHLVVNKCRSDSDREKVSSRLGDTPFSSITYLPFVEDVLDMEPDVSGLLDQKTPYTEAVHSLCRQITKTP